jgi:GNAT superfamily N-acetyltransferase
MGALPEPRTGVRVAPATAERWADLEIVFGTRGDPARCWCQWFFAGAEVAPGSVAAANRAALQVQVAQGAQGAGPGILAYLDGAPAGWVALGPRPRYTRLAGSPMLRGGGGGEPFSDPAVWSVTCFVVKVGARRRGVATALVAGAIDHARRSGAAVLEAYPVDLRERPGIAAASLYHGVLSMFLDAGFTETARPLPGRAVVRLALRG